MLDLGTLQAHIKLDGADKFNDALENAADKTDEAASAWTIAKGVLASEFVKKGIELAIDGLKRLADEFKKSVELFASTEQLKGGINKLFGEEAAKTVIENANNAFSSVGISANDYMQNVTTFSASLIDSLGGDTEAAAQVADQAMRDIADNANTYGTSTVEDLSNVYKNLAKEQYTTLDNLNLGFAGSKEGMQALLDKAEELSGQHYELGDFADMVEAIHVVQEEMNITGTTANEAAGTIQGSFDATKAAYENLLAGMADPDADLDALIDNLFDSLGNVLDNLAPVADRIIQGLEKILPKIEQKIGPLIQKMEPYVTQALSSLGSLVLNGIGTLISDFFSSRFGALVLTGVGIGVLGLINPIAGLVAALVVTLGGLLLGYLEENWPTIKKWFEDMPNKIKEAIGNVTGTLKEKGRAFITGLKDGIVKKAQEVWTWFKKLAKNVKTNIGNTASSLKQKGIDFISGLKSGIVERAKDVWTWFKNLVSTVKSKIGDTASSLRQKGTDFISGLLGGIKNKFDDVVSWVKNIPSKIKSALGNTDTLLSGAGRSIVQGLINGMGGMVGSLIEKAKSLASTIKANKGPKPYDLKLLVENGQWIMDGLIGGIDSMVPDLLDTLHGVSDRIANTRLAAPTLTAAGGGMARAAMAVAGTTNNTNYNLYINGAQINSDAAIESKFVDLISSMARKGMM